MTKRGFQVAGGFKDAKINLPERATKNAAGYDFECAEDTIIPSVCKGMIRGIISKSVHDDTLQRKFIKPTLVPTGVKAYMGPTEGLFLYNRSSNPLKKFIALANGVGVVDIFAPLKIFCVK